MSRYLLTNEYQVQSISRRDRSAPYLRLGFEKCGRKFGAELMADIVLCELGEVAGQHEAVSQTTGLAIGKNIVQRCKRI